MSDEEWRPVVGWQGLFEVSSQGRVRSMDRTITRVDGRVWPYRGKLLTPAEGQHGYLHVCLSARPRKQVVAPVHRLVLEAFAGPAPDGHEAAHLDGDKNNNWASNLAWATPKENHSHRVQHGTHLRGEASPLHKLTSLQVAEIRRLGRTMRPVEIAGIYNIDRSHIAAIIRRQARPYD